MLGFVQRRRREGKVCAWATPTIIELMSVRVHFVPAEIAITYEFLGQYIGLLDQSNRRSPWVLLKYRAKRLDIKIKS